MTSKKIDKGKFLEEFIPDGKDLTEKSEAQLLELEKRVEDGSEIDPEFLNSIFRSFHTLKGTAGFFELRIIVLITHAAETLLDLLRGGKHEINLDYTNVLMKTCDMLFQIFDSLEEGENEADFKEDADKLAAEIHEFASAISQGKESKEERAEESETSKFGLFDDGDAYGLFDDEKEKITKFEITGKLLKQYLVKAQEMLSQVEESVLNLERNPYELENLERVYQLVHSLKGNSGMMGFHRLEKFFSSIEDQVEDFQGKDAPLSREELNTLLTMTDLISQVFDNLKETGNIKSQSINDLITKIEKSRVNKLGEILVEMNMIKPDILEKNLKNQKSPKIGNLLVESGHVKSRDLEKALEVQKEAKDTQNQIKKELASMAKSRASHEITDIRISTKKIDSLMDLIGELVIAESMVTQNPDLHGLELANFKRSSLHLNKIIRNLQEVALSVRMIPVSGVFQKMSRLVRDLARKFDKTIDLKIIGEDTEVDKTVIEKISDPLVHIIRNALDHGIETKENRRESGKPDRGKLVLEARHSGNEVWIIIKDDGKGLDREKILNKALTKGLITEEEMEMEDNKVWDLIFHPGLSTAGEVTDVSGRGVGMDVVKKNLTQINGRIDIRSTRGEGSAFLLRIPLTLAIIEGMVVRYAKQFYIIPTIAIKESVNLKNMNCKKISETQEILKFRGNYIPISTMGELLNLEHERDFRDERPLAVVVEQNGQSLGLVIDEIVGNQSIVIKSLSEYITKTKGVSGCTILGNGEVSLILDIGYLVNQLNYESISTAV